MAGYDSILNYGGGLGSTALLVAVVRGLIRRIPPERTIVIFADTGAERPWTYEYLRVVREFCALKKMRFEVVRAKYSLEEYAFHSGILPSQRIRWCTHRLKIRPIRKRALCEDVEKPYNQLIGFLGSEAHRMNMTGLYSDCVETYPLIDLGWDRRRAIPEITGAGLPVPMKSACFCCPFQRLSTFVTLMNQYPELKKRVIALEDYTNKNRNGKPPFYLFKEPAHQIIARSDKIIARAIKRGTYLDDFGLEKTEC